MIHSRSNSPPAEVSTTGGMIHSGTNSPPLEVSTTGGMIHSGLILHQKRYRLLVG
jgi:hypothetical protein